MKKAENKSTLFAFLYSKKEYIFLLGIFIFYFSWAVVQPLNSSPDEESRYLIPKFIYNHFALPHGSDPEIRNKIWGSSYGFTPILSYIISGIFMRITSIFTTNSFALLMSARMVSVLCGVGTVFMSMKISKKLFCETRYRVLMVLFVAFLPQAVFITSYVNTDSFAIFITSVIVYIWIIAIKSMWAIKHCIYLGIALGVCSLSYYNAYGYLVCSVVIFVMSILLCKNSDLSVKLRVLECVKKGLIVTAFVFLVAGWWFIRNAILYNGDILGNATSDLANELYAHPMLDKLIKPAPQEAGTSLAHMLFVDHWLIASLKSFVGMFGYHTIHLPTWIYVTYLLLFSAGIIGVLMRLVPLFRLKQNKKYLPQGMFNLTMALATVFPPLISMYYSYTSDFQAQGRYWLPMLIPFMYFMTIGLQKLSKFLPKSKEKLAIICADTAITAIGLSSYFFVFLPAYI